MAYKAEKKHLKKLSLKNLELELVEFRFSNLKQLKKVFL